MITSAQHVATDLLLTVLLVGSYCVFSVNGSSFVIDDERVKTIDISPALGRGYSNETNQFHSICLDVEETTDTVYRSNYTTYADVTSALDENTSTKVSGKVQKSFGWAKVKARMEADKETSLNYQTQTVMTIMRFERYFASIMGNRLPLSADANLLLANKDFVGFYKSCEYARTELCEIN